MSLPGVTGVDPDLLQASKTDFTTTVGEYEVSLGKVAGYIAEIASTWDGHLYSQCVGLQTNWNSNMQKYNNAIQAFGEALGAVGINYVELDNSVTGV